MKKFKPVTVVILDGWGESRELAGNAVRKASTPTTDMLDAYYPKTLLQASGVAVGLPWGEGGNSEVGHLSMGVGRIIYQSLPRITLAIEDGSFYENKVFLEAIEFCKKNNSALHLAGLVSDGGVHADISHLIALLETAAEEKAKNVFVHAITDGRDTPSRIAAGYLNKVQQKMDSLGIGKVATLSGRYFAMDRNKNYDRTEKALRAMVNGDGLQEKSYKKALEKQYKKGKNDEYLEPVVLTDEKDEPIAKISDKDVVIFFNFRKDRAIQLAKSFTDKKIQEEKLSLKMPEVRFISMVQYEEGIDCEIAFPPEKAETCLGKILSENNKKQLRVAETEKYAHVTYFFNAGEEKPYPGEDRTLIPSKNVPAYDRIPEMSAAEITEKVLEAVDSNKYDFILINYANPDMVGHTGNLEAAAKGIEVVDENLSKVIKAVLDKNGALLITADHGNAEEMIDPRTGEKVTEHSSNPVPCWLVTTDNKRNQPLEEEPRVEIGGMLCDVAPTILELMGVEKSPKINCESLLDSFK